MVDAGDWVTIIVPAIIAIENLHPDDGKYKEFVHLIHGICMFSYDFDNM